MKKIAITGIESDARKVLTQALSYLTGYSIVRQTAYSSQAIKYGLNKELKDCEWHELFIYALASFSERIEIEQHFDSFISNGSVFNELAYMKTISGINFNEEKESEEQFLMYTGLSRIVSDYASRTYDCIIHVCDQMEDESDVFSYQLNNSLRNLLKGCKSTFFVQKNTMLIDILTQVSRQIDIKPILSPGIALRKAQQELFDI